MRREGSSCPKPVVFLKAADSLVQEHDVVKAVNKFFFVSLTGRAHVLVFTPIAALTVLDLIAPKRINWPLVAWDVAAVHSAMNTNHQMAQKLWDVCNMRHIAPFSVSSYAEGPSVLQVPRGEEGEDEVMHRHFEFLKLLLSFCRRRFGRPFNPVAHRLAVLPRRYYHKVPHWIEMNREACDIPVSKKTHEPEFVLLQHYLSQRHCSDHMWPEDDLTVDQMVERRHYLKSAARNYRAMVSSTVRVHDNSGQWQRPLPEDEAEYDETRSATPVGNANLLKGKNVRYWIRNATQLFDRMSVSEGRS
mmetsp:Transcript_64403/g.172424  ORF Transcript_64403/g.172424 Transcript_64403/m.172424 type:complete len:303 (+) Transcript_64403:435-1343(+)